MTQPTNVDQAEFWNAEPGMNWVRLQPDLDAIHAGVLAMLMRACDARPGERVLDIGCGAGASSLALAAAVGPTGWVEGVDISTPLLARAAERARAAGLGNVRFLLADAQDHAFDPGSFDLAASRFGVMFFEDPVAAFRNIAAALRRPGGRCVFAAWAGAEHNPWFAWPQRIAVERLRVPEPPATDAPGPMAFRDIDRVCGVLRAAGFGRCAGEAVDLDLHHPGGLDAATHLVTYVGPIARLLRERGAGGAERDAMVGEIAEAFAPFVSDDGIRVPARINLFTAVLE